LLGMQEAAGAIPVIQTDRTTRLFVSLATAPRRNVELLPPTAGVRVLSVVPLLCHRSSDGTRRFERRWLGFNSSRWLDRSCHWSVRGQALSALGRGSIPLGGSMPWFSAKTRSKGQLAPLVRRGQPPGKRSGEVRSLLVVCSRAADSRGTIPDVAETIFRVCVLGASVHRGQAMQGRSRGLIPREMPRPSHNRSGEVRFLSTATTHDVISFWV
jgi:hypothetical protein